MKIKDTANQLKKDIPAVFLALKRKETPWPAQILALLTVGYALSPIDLIPDFIPILGYLDDLVLLPLLIAVTLKLIPKEVMEQCRKESEEVWKDGKPEKWYYAVPIVIIWLVIFILIIKAFIS